MSEPESLGLWFFVAQRAAIASPAHCSRHFSEIEGISYTHVRLRCESQFVGLVPQGYFVINFYIKLL